MKKTIIALTMAGLMLFSAGTAGAFFGGGDTNECTNGSCNENKSHHNNYGTINNGGPTNTYNVPIGIGKGGDGGNAKATSKSSANADAKAAAGAVAVGVQGQAQKAVANNAGNSQEVEVSIKESNITNIIDFNHIVPTVGKTDAELHAFSGGTAKMSGVWKQITDISMGFAKSMSKNTTDYKVIPAIMFENDFRTTMLRKAEGSEGAGILMGSATFVEKGDAITIDGLFGRAMRYGMSIGATHYHVVAVSEKLAVEGGKAGIDFGGAASVVAKADGSVVVAPGATLGYSKAWSDNEYRPGLVVAFYFDDTMKITPARSGNHN